MGEFRLDCPFCEQVLESEAVDTVKNRGTTHLGDRHDTELTSVFAETYSDDECRNCGSAFEIGDGGDRVEGFECPNCSYDNFQPLVQQYLYWQIESD